MNLNVKSNLDQNKLSIFSANALFCISRTIYLYLRGAEKIEMITKNNI